MQAPLQKYAAVLREKAAQRRAMQSGDQVQLGRKASLIDGASDSEEEDEPALKQSEREDEAHEAEEVCSTDNCFQADQTRTRTCHCLCCAHLT